MLQEQDSGGALLEFQFGNISPNLVWLASSTLSILTLLRLTSRAITHTYSRAQVVPSNPPDGSPGAEGHCIMFSKSAPWWGISVNDVRDALVFSSILRPPVLFYFLFYDFLKLRVFAFSSLFR